MYCASHQGMAMHFSKVKTSSFIFFHHLSFLSFTRTLTSHAAMSNSFLAIETFHLPASEALSYALSSILFSKQESKQESKQKRDSHSAIIISWGKENCVNYLMWCNHHFSYHHHYSISKRHTYISRISFVWILSLMYYH